VLRTWTIVSSPTPTTDEQAGAAEVNGTLNALLNEERQERQDAEEERAGQGHAAEHPRRCSRRSKHRLHARDETALLLEVPARSTGVENDGRVEIREEHDEDGVRHVSTARSAG